MALSRRIAVVTSLLVFFGALSACSGFKKVPDACTVTIAPRDITVPVNASTTAVGTAFDCDGNSIAKKTVKFNSRNSNIASVTPTGQIIGVSVGTTVVSAVADGKSGDANVTVTPENVATVTITPTTATLRRGNVRTLAAVAKNVLGNVISGITFQWASSNSSIASVDNTGKVSALAPGTVNITATSDGQTGTSLLTITEIPIGSCSLSPLSQKVTVSSQVQPTLTLKDTAGNALSPTGRGINWTSDNDLIATVTNTGVVTARRAGTAKITASDLQNAATSCSANVEVVDARIVSARISPVNALLRVGAPVLYTVALLDSNSTTILPAGRTITWKNITPSIATVSIAGVVTGLQTGSGRVAVDAEGVVDTVSFTVSKIPVGIVTVSPPQRSVVEGQTAQFTPTVKDESGNVVTDRVIDWLSSNPSIAAVSSAGLVTTSAPGTVTITAISETKSGTATLIITPVPVDSIFVEALTFSVQAGKNTVISITLKDAAGNQLRNRTVSVTSDQPGVATGTANAAATTVTISGVTAGSATLTIQALNANNQNEGKKTKVIVSVTP